MVIGRSVDVKASMAFVFKQASFFSSAKEGIRPQMAF